MVAGLAKLFNTERVRWVRYGCEREAECQEQRVQVLDVSVGGMRIRSPRRFTQNEKLTLSMPDNSNEVRCRVVWSDSDEGEQAITGLAFVDAPATVRSWVYEMVFQEAQSET